MLKEVLDGPFVDPLKNLRLPRELNPNRKYSWMQKKDERVRCPGPGLGGWGGRGVPPERPPRLGLGRLCVRKGLFRTQLPPPVCWVVPGKLSPLPGSRFIT